jgi:3D (Asp-Asp-Asp) domain-containing protein
VSLRGSLALASWIAVAWAAGARAMPPPESVPKGAGDSQKGVASSDGDEVDAKLPVRPKVKECCGYPIAPKDGFRLSFYWIAYEQEYAHEKYDTDIYDRMGFWIGRYPSAFVYELKLEGTGVLRDGRVINYDGPCQFGIGTCFSALEWREHPLGRGVQNRPLEPFRSVAVDPRFIPIGSPIFVPEIVGMELPDGSVHDGCLRADDMGGAIKFQKLDFFVESYFNFKFLADQLWWHLKATPHLDEPRCEYLRTHEPREHQNDHTDWAMLHSKQMRQALANRARQTKERQAFRDKQAKMAALARVASKQTLTSVAKRAPGKRR